MAEKTITLLTEDGEGSLSALATGGDLWIAASDMARATGWKLTPEGFCRDAVCIPIPPGREAEFVHADRTVNLVAFARQRGQALVCDDGRDVWALDAVTSARTEARTSLEAPDFTLPDLTGQLHSLHAFRGKKVLLASWASW